MARPIERIEKDIVELEKAIKDIGQQLHSAYESYLEVLGQALRQQLILASYHLCTQGYPDSFLSLSLSQRQKLQKAMRKLAKSAAQDMQTLIEIDDEEESEEVESQLETSDSSDFDLEEIEQEESIEDLVEEKLDFEDDELEEITQGLEIEDKDLEEIVEKLGMEDTESEPKAFDENISPSSLPLDAKIAFLSAKKGQPPVFSLEPEPGKDWKNWFNPNTSNPMELAAWQKNLERAISYILKTLSRDGNRLLQKASILPKKLPEQVLEAAAASAEGSSDVMPGPPNILSLVVGINSDEQQEPENLTKVMALNLRLVEIEFADIKLSSERKQIRNILNQLGKLGREYQKKQRERSIAAAEAAWRASWYED
ncbi:hypothetical protein Riv7116_4208 [Rivularia sp. PCC 7116]|uniref:hypothetical protein n=1 Tax=Rivularia sp. PCC 7116 TaxID=373994 RepID=UPI00029F33FF|nr:hypothetical protein [Rivularia sp. PCC 7116]AFY56639.1 hypothetical protein Riv7116_4208 [Rivularia sp. PCC 7116]